MNKALPISLEAQANEFADLWIGKSYDQAFHIGLDSSGKVREAIRDHVEKQMYQHQGIAPFSMETYTKWNGDDKEYVRLWAQVSHDQQSGFKIDHASIELRNRYGYLDQKVTLSPSKNDDLPTQEQCNNLVDSYKLALEQNKLRIDTINSHRDEFVKLLTGKDYRQFDGLCFTESVSDSLQRISVNILNQSTDNRFKLSTLIKISPAHSLDRSRKYIRCALHGSYDQTTGFSVNKVSAGLIKNAFGAEYTIRDREFPINNNNAIPSPNDLRQFLTHTRQVKQRHQN